MHLILISFSPHAGLRWPFGSLRHGAWSTSIVKTLSVYGVLLVMLMAHGLWMAWMKLGIVISGCATIVWGGGKGRRCNGRWWKGFGAPYCGNWNGLSPIRGKTNEVRCMHYTLSVRDVHYTLMLYALYKDSPGLTWTHWDSLGLNWVHLDSIRFDWTHLESLGLIWIH